MTRALLQQALDALLHAVPRTSEQAKEQADAIVALRAELAKPEQPAQEPTAASVYEAIKHGDDQHRAWLRDALTAIWAGQPVPELQPPAKPAQEPTTAVSLQCAHCQVTIEQLNDKVMSLMKQFEQEADMKLFSDCKTDKEKSNFFLSGRGYETGVIAKSIQNDVAMAYHRLSLLQPVQEPRPPNCGTGHCSCIECHDPAYRAMVRGIGGKA